MKVDIDKDIDMHLPAPNKQNRCLMMLLAFIICTALSALALYNKNYLTLEPGAIQPVAKTLAEPVQQRELESNDLELQRLQGEFASLKNQLVAMNRENSILVATNKELNRKLLKVEDELTDAKNKQLLYEDILAPDDLEQGLHVRHFSLREHEADEDDRGRRYSYLLVLSQARGGKKIIQGQYIIRLYGTLNGKKKNYNHRELTADGVEANRKFSLKYYQSLEGEVILPDGFEPEKVTLWIIPKSKNYANQSKNYQWKPLISQNKLTEG